MAIIYSVDLPNDWCLVPVENFDGFKETDFQVGCMVLHLPDSSIFSPTERPICDLVNKNKKRPFNTDATLGIQPEKLI